MNLPVILWLSWVVLCISALQDPPADATKVHGDGELLSIDAPEGARRARQLDARLPEAAAHVLTSYFNSTEMEAHMRGYVKRCSHLARMFSVGQSVHGRDLWVLEVSTKPGLEEAKPRVKYVANMHGDEPSGRQLLLALAEWLCAEHASDARAARMTRDMHLFLMPSMNPDGFEARSRGNARRVDLNRDFPDQFQRGASGVAEPSGSEQPETLALMNWIRHGNFVASASLHEGALVANYPWDGSDDRGAHYSRCPDDAAYAHLAAVYAGAHAKMRVDNREFAQGVTNGAAWYPLWGGMQDWNYLAGDCMELTLELAPDKWPQPAQLPGLFADNLPAMLAFPLAAAFGGARGFVRERPSGQTRSALALGSAAKGRPLGAAIHVNGISKTLSASSTFGDFYRPLAPGVYNITAVMPGYANETRAVAVPEDGSGAFLEFYLEPLAGAAGALAQWAALPRRFGVFGGGGAGAEEAEQGNGGRIWDAGGVRLAQAATVVFAGLAVLLLLRSVRTSLYRRREPVQAGGGAGGANASPLRRTPPR